MKHHLLVFLFVFVMDTGFAIAKGNSWENVSFPSSGDEQSIGSYANGCLQGGVALPLSGEGYQVIRKSRNRYYGHPDMINYIINLSKKMKSYGFDDLIIADISMPRGGNFSHGHASHQMGLDADIWLRFSSDSISKQMLDKSTAISMVDLNNYTLRRENWKPDHAILLQVAASSPEVARIFVHPVIKETLCEMDWEDRSWLRKIRPWWGHHSHMHVRLHCPDGDTNCIAQKAPPAGDGCGSELISWRPKPKNEKKKSIQSKKNKTIKVKPEQCQIVLTK